MSRIKTLIADDSTLLRRLVADQLGREPDIIVVGDANDGREAVDLALRVRPDVVVLDLDMPNMNGMQAAQRLLGSLPNVRIILLTGHEQLASLGKLSGASECLIKTCTPQELANAIRRAYTTGRTETTVEKKDSQTTQRTLPVLARLAVQAGLSDKEQSVVEKMVMSEMTAAQIAYALSAEMGCKVTESGVKHSLERALNKLEIEPRTRAALIRRVLDARDGDQATG